MKKIKILIIAMFFLLPVWAWGDDPIDETLKYVPRTVVTGDASTLDNPTGDIVRYQYNPIESKWKVRANKCTIKYNPMENEWTYVYPGEVLRFNPAENDWDYQGIEKRLRYDITDEKWFYGYSLLPKKPEHPGMPGSTSPKP